jgi:hypothetical protein
MSINPDKFFESAIWDKMGPNIHYPKPIACPIFLVYNSTRACSSGQTLTNHCFEYGNTRFPYCNCHQKYDCRCQHNGCQNCSLTCGTCNHNSNVIFY